MFGPFKNLYAEKMKSGKNIQNMKTRLRKKLTRGAAGRAVQKKLSLIT